jgi:hypothetical protein
MRYATALHLCCCGCASEVVTPLAPAQWKLTFDGENVSLYPSVGSWNLPCRSHYILRNGLAIEAPTWSEEEVEFGQARDKQARVAYYNAKGSGRFESELAQDAAKQKLKGWLAKFGDVLFSRR